MTMARLNFFFALLLGAACGGSSSGAQTGPMPTGGTFQGVWYSPQYGRLDMRQTGTTVLGEYTKEERSGRIQGNVQGRVLKFQWTEERELIEGMNRATSGRGYFMYVIDNDGEHKLQGEWGHDTAETGGGPWNAVKSKRGLPRLSTDSVSEPAQPSTEDEAAAAVDDDESSTNDKKVAKKASGAKSGKKTKQSASGAPSKDAEESDKALDDIDDLSDL